jgi:hypothetical protein
LLIYYHSLTQIHNPHTPNTTQTQEQLADAEAAGPQQSSSSSSSSSSARDWEQYDSNSMMKKDGGGDAEDARVTEEQAVYERDRERRYADGE